MTRSLVAAALAAFLALGGCLPKGSNGSGAPASPAALVGSQPPVVAAVQRYAKTGCSFAPKASFVVKIAALYEPSLAEGADIVTYLGDLVCAAARTSYASLRAGGRFTHGEVLGVTVEGQFLR